MASLGDVFKDADVARLYRYRAPYPEGVFAILERLIVEPHVVLDAGAGSGALARRMLSFADRVDAVDASAEMVAAGRALPGGDDPRIRWVTGHAEDAPLSPPYGLITCGASLHWMDLDIVLPRFRGALARDAVLAIVDVDNVHGPYHGDVLQAIKEHSELEHHRGTNDLVDDLRRSQRLEVFGEERTDPVRYEQSVSAYIEYLHSTSTLARVRLGARADGFDRRIREIFASRRLDRVAFDQVGYVAWGRPR